MEALTCNKMKVSLGSSMLGGDILVQAVEERDARVHANGSNQNKNARVTGKLNFIRLRLIC